MAPISFNNKFWTAIWMSWSEVGADRKVWASFNGCISVQLRLPHLSSEPCKSLRSLANHWASQNLLPVSLRVPEALTPSLASHRVTGGQIFTYKHPANEARLESLLTHRPHQLQCVTSCRVKICFWPLNGIMSVLKEFSYAGKKYSVVWWQKHAFGTRQTHVNALSTLSFIQWTHTSWVPTMCPASTVLGPKETMVNKTEKFLPSWSLHFSGEDWQ